MQLFKKYVHLVLLLTFIQQISFAQQWNFIGGPVEEKRFQPITIEANDNIVLMAALSSDVVVPKIYRSTDNGITWQAPKQFQDPGSIRCFLIADDVMLAGHADVHSGVPYFTILRSLDDGITWDKLENDLDEDVNINSFLSLGNSILAATSDGLFISVNKGENWVSSQSGMPESTEVHGLVTKESAIFAATSKGIYKSTDSGKTWTVSGTGVPSNAIVKDIIVTNNVIVADGYRSTDNGETWAPLPKVVAHDPTRESSLLRGIYDFAARNDTLVAAAVIPVSETFVSFGTYISTDAGLTWKRSVLLSGDESGDLISSNVVYYFNYGKELAANSKYFFANTNSGDDHFISRSADIEKWDYPGTFYRNEALASNETHLFSALRNKIFRSENGTDWETILTMPSSHQIDVLDGKSILANDNEIHFVADNIEDNRRVQVIYQSSDNGENWNQIPSPKDTIYEITRIGERLIVRNIRNKYYVRDDDEGTWKTYTPGNFTDIKRIFRANEQLYGYNCQKIFGSDDAGLTWELVADLTDYFINRREKDLFQDECIESLAIQDQSFFARVKSFYTWNPKIFTLLHHYSNDMGASGDAVDFQEEYFNQNYPEYLGPALPSPIGFFGSNAASYSRTGEVLEYLSAGFPGPIYIGSCGHSQSYDYDPPCWARRAIDYATIFKNKIYFNAVGGIWSRDLSDIKNQIPEPPPPVGIFERHNKNKSLSVFPNPTTGAFNVKYHTTSSTPVELEVLDMMGRRMINTTMERIDDHWYASITLQDHPSACYVLRIRAENNTFATPIVKH